jgi:hypothetical protein
MSKTVRLVLVATLICVVGAIAAFTYVAYSLRHVHPGFFSVEDVGILMKAAQTARAAIAEERKCRFTIDESSIGDRKREAEMSYLAAMIDLYRVKFGTTPTKIADLNDLPGFGENNRSNVGHLEKECAIHTDPGGASVVACGTGELANADLGSLFRMGKDVEKFYRVGDDEVLFIPSPKCP